jgi:GntR family transcriptional repressor for pyruvate dehydrogenase complex
MEAIVSLGSNDLSRQISSTARGSSRSMVERALRWKIGTGVWRPGEAIPSERELARELGVGRSTLRSAIDVLRAEGLLMTSIGRNGRTRLVEWQTPAAAILSEPPLRQGILHHFELRCAVELEAADLAAQRGTVADFDRLRDILHQPVTSLRSYRALNSQFHIAIADACGNPLIRKVVAELCVDFFGWAETVAVASGDHHPAGYGDFALTHRSIYEKLMTRDAAGARDEVMAHLVAARDSFLENLDDGAAHERA